MTSGLKVENLDHLGLIAGVIDELELVKLLDELFPPHRDNLITTGQVVKAMILNCLGFLSAPLYLFGQFFESKPVAHLLGEGIEASHLNDDRLGRVLDQLWKFGLSSLFVRIAMAAVSKFNVGVSQVHLDSSSFSVHGQYLNDNDLDSTLPKTGHEAPSSSSQSIEETAQPATREDDGEPVPIELRRGYSRDQRPDLKQFISNLCCSRDGGVPLFLEVASGNQSDRQEFGRLMEQFNEHWHIDAVFVVDAAFYSEPNLKRVKDLRWISRVPLTISAAKALIHQDTDHLEAVECTLKDYKMWEIRSSYGGVEQRWILVESQSRKAQTSLWEKDLKRIETALKRQVKALQKQVFACRPDALEALLQFQESLEHHQVSEAKVETVLVKRAPGEPKSSKPSEAIEGYQVRVSWQRQPEAEQKLRESRSRFILATNQLDTQTYPAQFILTEYKQQQKVERGFRFLKDPLFFTSSVFVKKAQRVAALAFLMAVTLLIYTLAERKIRQSLEQEGETVLNQLKRPTATPTFRWIMQKFQGIHLVLLNGIEQVTNLTNERCLIIRLLGPPACRYYLVS